MPLPARPLYDPFVGTVTQTNRLRAICKIIVGGVDVTAKIDPHLINLHVIDGKHPMAHIELDDRDGRLPLPPVKTPVDVYLGWLYEPVFKVFGGIVVDIEHGFGREQGGRRLWIHASGWNPTVGKGSELNTWGEGDPVGGGGQQIPMGQVLKDMFKNQNMSIDVHSAFSNIMRNFWMQGNESPVHAAQRMANEHGAQFRVTDGTKGEFTKYGENADGSPTVTIIARWADNLIGWRVHLVVARNSWKSSRQGYYDAQKGKWNQVTKNFAQQGIMGAIGAGSSDHGHPGSAANSNNAGQDNSGSEESASNEFGNGRIVINGEPRAGWGCKVRLIGARLGVDGLYQATQVEHIYSRQGYVTWLDVFPKWVPAGIGLNNGEVPQPNVTDGMTIRGPNGRYLTYEEFDELLQQQTDNVFGT